MKSMKGLRIPTVNTNINPTPTPTRDLVAAQILLAATNGLDDANGFRMIRKNFNIKRTDGNGVISGSSIYKNVCKQLIMNEDNRKDMAQLAIDHKMTPEEVIGFQVSHLFKALKLVLVNPKVACLVHEAGHQIYKKGQTGEFSLDYRS